ncbi:MAG: TetR/AcrR family transcriptional regulator [Lachnospiraceae bacterium]
MKKSDQAKEIIISKTIELIENSTGNIDEITTRTIAEKANVGVGLINYHFQTKDNLIEICVQRIIGKVISTFSPINTSYKNNMERLIAWAIQVFDFLFENQAVSRISIIGDLSHFSPNNNTDKSKKGFMLAIGDDMDSKEKKLLAFTLTSAMQGAFLLSNDSKEVLGYDFSDKADRDRYITNLVTMLYGKMGDA